MAQYDRNQNESGRWQDYPRRNAGGRERQDFGGRDRYETGNERRYSPDWGDRSFDAGQYDDTSRGYEGDRSYSAGGYSEEFGHRRENYGRDRDNQRFGEQPDRFGGYYGASSLGRYGRNQDYGSRDFDQAGGSREQSYRHDPYRSEEMNRGRGGYSSSYGEQSGSQRFGGGGYSSYGSQGNFGQESNQGFGRSGSGSGESSWQSQQQSHRGRGPKGYERSDERLKEMICERLTDDPSIDASEVTVEVNNKTVKLTGNVENRRIKYLIEDVIEQIGGTRDIDNQLRVQSSSTTQQQGQSSSQSQYGSGQYGTSGSESSYGARTDNKSGTQTTTPGMTSTKRN